MSDEYFDPIVPEAEEPQNNTTKIIVIVVVVVVICLCVCLCVFFGLPLVLGPTIGDVFSRVIDEMMLTPMP